MPRNGSGTYSPPAGQPVVSGTTVLASTFNSLVNDLSTEMTRSLSTDGQTPMGANLPMGGNKIVNVAAGSSASDAARMDQVTVKVNTADLAANSGSTLVGFLPAGTGAVARTAQDKHREIPSAKDYGAKLDGTTDDTTAIANARAAVSANGGMILYGAKSSASGFWENLAPLAMEWVKGSASAHATDIVASKPLIAGKMWNATLTAGAGYAGYVARMDGYTKTGVDVASTVVGMFSMQSYSTNSSGTNFNNTFQVALVANSSAMDSASSASVEAVNAIAYSAYTGTLPQVVVGIESDVGAERTPGWYGDASKAYGVAYSAVLSSGTKDFTAAFGCDTSSSLMAFLHGYIASGVRTSGVTVVRNGAIVPDTGISVVAAGTYGVYVGAKNRFNLNPGSVASYTYKPIIGIALGQEGATSANSHKLRLVSTDGASAEYATDIYAISGGNVNVDFAGTTKFSIASFDGSVAIQGTKVLGTRDTGWGTNTGATSKAAFDTSTATTSQVAQALAAVIQALKNHGLIGA